MCSVTWSVCTHTAAFLEDSTYPSFKINKNNNNNNNNSDYLQISFSVSLSDLRRGLGSANTERNIKKGNECEFLLP